YRDTPLSRAGWRMAIAVLLGASGAALAGAAGCSYAAVGDDGPPGFHDADAGDETDAIVIDIGSDTPTPNPLCGPIPCNPDDFDPDAGPHTCTPFDGGFDGDVDAPPAPPDTGDDGDTPVDTGGSGTRNACRVVKTGSTVITACAPAGFATVNS